MTVTIERATLGLALFALAAAGSQCAAPSEAPAERPSDGALGRDARRAPARALTVGDGGLEGLGDGSPPELEAQELGSTRCWRARVVDERARPRAAVVLAVDAEPADAARPFRAEARFSW